MVVSMSRLKSISLRLALAVNKSRNVSNGEKFSSSFGRPMKNQKIFIRFILMINAIQSFTSYFHDINETYALNGMNIYFLNFDMYE